MGHESRHNTHDLEGQPQVLDRLQRPVTVGANVILLNQPTILWRVQEITPVLHPGAPAHLMQLSLVAVFATGVPGRQPIQDLVLVRSAEETRAAAPLLQAPGPEGQQ